jgi:formamidopyrimidine-DNA glycosylase
VLALRRRSKYILADLDTGERLIMHLGMSGRHGHLGAGAAHVPGSFISTTLPAEKHDHVMFDMENGARVTFNDPRRFGAMDLRNRRAGRAPPSGQPRARTAGQ